MFRSLNTAIVYPFWPLLASTSNIYGYPEFTNIHTLDAVSEKVAFLGCVWIDGAPSSSKTISSSGGKIHWQVGSSVTWATSGTTIRVGLQDIVTSGTPIAVPDGTWDVYDDLVQGTDSLTANTWTSAVMSSGSKTLSHMDPVALVIEMTARSGSDLVTVKSARFDTWEATFGGSGRTYTTSWGNSVHRTNAVIEFDDGTLGCIFGSMPGIKSSGNEAWGNWSDPDERGNAFVLPFSARLIGLTMWLQNPDGDDQLKHHIKLYSDPFGSPSLVASKTLEGAYYANDTIKNISFPPTFLRANTQYCISLRTVGTSNPRAGMRTYEFANAAYKKLIGAGSISKATRNNDTGAFTETAAVMYPIFLLLDMVESGVSPSINLGI